MTLPVELEALLVDVAIQMNGELRDARHTMVDLQESSREPVALVDDDPACDSEVAVGPGAEKNAA